MSVVDERSIFTAMKQEGPFAVQDHLAFGRVFTPQSRAWAREFYRTRLNVTKYRAVRGQVFDLLQIDSFAEIPGLIGNPATRAARSDRAYTLLANLFGIAGEVSEVRNNFV